ncbi:MAG: hypothetical protein AAGA56_27410 [Myxococcota bacterium]
MPRACLRPGESASTNLRIAVLISPLRIDTLDKTEEVRCALPRLDTSVSTAASIPFARICGPAH